MGDVPAHVALHSIQKEKQETASQDPPHGQAPGSTPENGEEAKTPMTLRLPPGGVKNKKAGWWSDPSPVAAMHFAGRIVG